MSLKRTCKVCGRKLEKCETDIGPVCLARLKNYNYRRSSKMSKKALLEMVDKLDIFGEEECIEIS